MDDFLVILLSVIGVLTILVWLIAWPMIASDNEQNAQMYSYVYECVAVHKNNFEQCNKAAERKIKGKNNED